MQVVFTVTTDKYTGFNVPFNIGFGKNTVRLPRGIDGGSNSYIALKKDCELFVNSRI